MIGLLTAVPKTPLYERLEKDGRLIKEASGTDNTKLGTNLIPKQMSYDEMVEGYRDLYYRLLDDKTIADRINNKMRYLKNPIFKSTYTLKDQAGAFGRFMKNGILKGGPRRVYHFLRTIPLRNPKQIPVVIQDWTVGIAMKDYVDRNFIREFDENNVLAESYSESIGKSFQTYMKKGALEVSLYKVKNATSNLSISIKGIIGQDFFENVVPHLEKVLENTSSSITFNIDHFHETQRQHMNRLFNRLARYGDRIYIAVNEKWRDKVNIDSSVFNLVLDN